MLLDIDIVGVILRFGGACWGLGRGVDCSQRGDGCGAVKAGLVGYGLWTKRG